MIRTSLLLVWFSFAIVAADQFTTNGTSGPPCGNNRCLGNGQAVCEDGECVCQDETTKGLGNFVCVRQDEDYAVVFNDPIVRGFDGSHTKIPLVCKFLAAHIATSTCTGGTPNNIVTTDGLCDVRAFVWGRRKLGKTFVRGIQVNVMVFIGNVSYHHSTRVETEVYNGQYIYSEEGNTNPFGAGPYGDPLITSIPGVGTIYTSYDNVDNFVRIVAQPCGIEVGMRGVDQIGDPLQLAAGMYIKVLRACQPTYLSNESCIFSPPPGHGLSLAQQAQIQSASTGLHVTPELLAVHKACSQPQDFPAASVEFQMLSDTLRECDATLAFAGLIHCVFIVHLPRFLKCYDKTTLGNVAINLLNRCIFSFCDYNRFMCQDVQSLITQSGCHRRLLPNQTSVYNFDCDSLVL